MRTVDVAPSVEVWRHKKTNAEWAVRTDSDGKAIEATWYSLYREFGILETDPNTLEYLNVLEKGKWKVIKKGV